MHIALSILAILVVVFTPLALFYTGSTGVAYNPISFQNDFGQLILALTILATIGIVGFLLVHFAVISTKFALLISVLINVVAIEVILIFFYTSIFDFSAFKASLEKLCGGGAYYSQYNSDYKEKLHNYCTTVEAVFGFNQAPQR